MAVTAESIIRRVAVGPTNVFMKFTLSITGTFWNQCTALPPASSGQLAE